MLGGFPLPALARRNRRIFEIDAHNALLGRVGGENPVLVGGDIVFVPEGKNLAWSWDKYCAQAVIR